MYQKEESLLGEQAEIGSMMECKKTRKWEYKDLRCRIRKIGYQEIEGLSHYCGYVEVPEALIGKIEKNEDLVEEIEVHGGVTFRGYFEKEPSMEKDVYWLGFDTGHAGDLNSENDESGPWFSSTRWYNVKVMRETELLAEQVLSYLPLLERRIRSFLRSEEKGGE